MRPELRGNKEIEHIGEPEFAGNALGAQSRHSLGWTEDEWFRLGRPTLVDERVGAAYAGLQSATGSVGGGEVGEMGFEPAMIGR